MDAGEVKKGEILGGPAERSPAVGGPEGWGPEGWGAQNFALFYSLSRHCFHSFFGGRFVEFGGVIEGRDPQMCTIGVLGLSCETPAAPEEHILRFGLSKNAVIEMVNLFVRDFYNLLGFDFHS